MKAVSEVAGRWRLAADGGSDGFPLLPEGNPQFFHPVPQGVRVHTQELTGSPRPMDLSSRDLEYPLDVVCGDHIQLQHIETWALRCSLRTWPRHL